MRPKIYTKTGDKGETGLYSGQRVSKDSPRMHAIGGVDELNAQLGVVRAEYMETAGRERRESAGPAVQSHGVRVDAMLHELQRQLFKVGADLSASIDSKVKVPRISTEEVAQLEAWIDELDAQLEPIQNFVLPSGGSVAAQLHLARSVCRRAERAVAALMKAEIPGSGAGGAMVKASTSAETVNPAILQYLNRLSDLLFVMARMVNREEGRDEEKWMP